MSARHHHARPLLVLGALALATVATQLVPAPNTVPNVSTLSGSPSAESRALLCPAFGGPLSGQLNVLNTLASPRRQTSYTALASVSSAVTGPVNTSNLAATQAYSPGLVLANGRQPNGVVVAQPGAGFAGFVAYAGDAQLVPCQSSAVTSWYATGFDTQGTHDLSLDVTNPTATPAVINVATWSSLGYVAPSSDQGLVISPLSTQRVVLTPQVVQASEIAVSVVTLRGRVTVQAVERGAGFTAVASGQEHPSTSVWFSALSSNNADTALLHLLNPTNQPEEVTVNVSVTGPAVSPFTLTVNPQTTTALAIVPSTRMPVAGDVALHVTSSGPLVADVTGLRQQHSFYADPAVGASRVVGWNFPSSSWQLVNTSNVAQRVTLRGIEASTSVTVRVPAHGLRVVRGDRFASNGAVLVSGTDVLVAVTTASSVLNALG